VDDPAGEAALVDQLEVQAKEPDASTT